MPRIRRRRATLVLAATLALASSALAGVAQATDGGHERSGGASAGAVARASVDRGAADKALEYWTPRRMKNAKPYNVRPTGTTGGTGTAPASTGPQVSIPATTGAMGGADTIAPMAASAVARPYTNLPDRLNVKIFFSKATGGNFVCSGTIVNSSTKRMVSTAGHCVANGTGGTSWHRNVIVVPGYASNCDGCNHAPYGRWSARLLTTTTEWLNFGNFKQDIGYIITNDLNGVRIVNRLGGQGSLFNAARTQQWRSYGYPQAAPFNGFNQFVCPSGRLADDNPTSRPGPLTIRIDCNMTGGASGGGWLVGESGGLGRVNSVNSYKYVSGPKANVNHMYGPYFGNEALSLFNYTVSQG